MTAPRISGSRSKTSRATSRSPSRGASTRLLPSGTRCGGSGQTVRSSCVRARRSGGAVRSGTGIRYDPSRPSPLVRSKIPLHDLRPYGANAPCFRQGLMHAGDACHCIFRVNAKRQHKTKEGRRLGRDCRQALRTLTRFVFRDALQLGCAIDRQSEALEGVAILKSCQRRRLCDHAGRDHL